jgi:hypothetical protein
MICSTSMVFEDDRPPVEGCCDDGACGACPNRYLKYHHHCCCNIADWSAPTFSVDEDIRSVERDACPPVVHGLPITAVA